MATTKNIGELTVDSVSFPSISACTLSYNKIWSSNAGRSSTGKMLGTIIAVKKKLEVTFNYLTEADVKKISARVDNKTAFHTIQYYDVASNETTTFTGYFGDSSYPIYGFDSQGNVCVTGYQLSIVER